MQKCSGTQKHGGSCTLSNKCRVCTQRASGQPFSTNPGVQRLFKKSDFNPFAYAFQHKSYSAKAPIKVPVPLKDPPKNPSRAPTRPNSVEKTTSAPILKEPAPQVPQAKKYETCAECIRKLKVDNLFCNSFCGHYFCSICIAQIDGCSLCKAQIDKQQAKTYFVTYCAHCQNPNCRIVNDYKRLCAKCDDEDSKRTRLKNNQKSDLESMLCLICMDKQKNYCCFPCGHMEYCQNCIEVIKKAEKCAKCSEGVIFTHKIYY